MNAETAAILGAARAALELQHPELVAKQHAILMGFWPDYAFATLPAFMGKLRAIRRSAQGHTGDAPTLTPYRHFEMIPGHSYLAAMRGQTTSVFKLVTTDTPPAIIAAYPNLYRID